MKVLLDASEIADQLAECEVGDTKVITFTVTAKSDAQIEGDATSAEYADESEEHDPDYEEAEKRGSKVPKAILLVAGK